jgi:hypothetical protein
VRLLGDATAAQGRVVTRPAMTAAAVWLQRHIGAAVFPVDHPGLPRCAGSHRPGEPCDGKRGKHPACRWTEASTTDPEAITAALAGRLRNIGIDTRKSGLLVVDEDEHGAFTRYEASSGQQVPETFTVSTAAGRHFYFRQPAGDPLGNGTGALAGWPIDIRGRGYVVAPGSVHETGVIYTPADPRVPVAPAPGWLVTALRSPGPGARFQQPAQRRIPVGSVRGRLRGLLAVVLDSTPPAGDRKGNRNERLYWAACKAAEMVTAGELDQGTAVRVLTEAGESTGLGRGAVAATIASAMRGAGR